MDITKFTLKTAADTVVRLGAGANGTALLFSLGVAAARNAVESLSNKSSETPNKKAHTPSKNPEGQPIAQA